MKLLIKQKMLLMIRALYFCMEEHWSELGKEFDLSPAQQHILFLLSIYSSLTPSQISDLGCWHISTVSRLLKPLQVKGLICVSPDVNQRRYKIVTITESGEQVFQKLVESVQQMEHFPFPMDHLSENELFSFLNYGQSILEVMKGESFGDKVINVKLEGVDYN